jgi:protein-S-isoprenylcysteine O-methyltransferase Ste14
MTWIKGGAARATQHAAGSRSQKVSHVPSARRPLLLLIPPPILYAAFFGVGLVLDRLAPWSPTWMQSEPARWIGGLATVAAAVLGPASLGLFWLRRTTVIPHGDPARLVTDGPFAISRNPMYVALTLLYCGAAILMARAWPLALAIGPVAVMQRVIIPFEERRLGEAFGRAYADYCRRVRRWL